MAVVVGRRGGVVACLCDSSGSPGGSRAGWRGGGRASPSAPGLATGWRCRSPPGAPAAGSSSPASAPSSSFSATAARPPAGLYRAEKQVAGRRYLGGWIVLPGGSQRGAVKVGATAVASPVLAPQPPAVLVAGADGIAVGIRDPRNV